MLDLTGNRFGRLTVIGRTGNKRAGHILWLCMCDCGNIKEYQSNDLRCGKLKSCGCLKKEQCINRSTKHNFTKTEKKLYSLRSNMIDRCYNEKNIGYHRYGGRGIYVCDLWRHNVKAFVLWAKKNGYSEDLQIDRINNNGPYCPSNCRFVDRKTNVRNRRNTMRLGKFKCLMEVLEKLGNTKYEMIRHFIKSHGALSTVVQENYVKKYGSMPVFRG